MRLQIAGFAGQTVGPIARGITALDVYDGPAGPVILATSGAGGTLSSYGLNESGQLLLRDVTYFSNAVSGAVDGRVSVLALDEAVYALAGAQGSNQLLAYGLQGAQGDDIGAARLLGASNLAPDATAQTYLSDSGFLFVSGADGVLRCFRPDANGTALQAGGISRDTAESHFAQTVSLSGVRHNGRDYLVALCGQEIGISLFEIDPNTGHATHKSALGASLGLGMFDTPLALETVVLEGRAYSVVLSVSQGSTSAALSVIEITQNGGLVVTDHILDSRATRFGNATALSVVEDTQGRVHVAAAGGDGGISLFTLLPGGQLLHSSSLETSGEDGLDSVSTLVGMADGSGLHFVLAGQTSAGVIHLRSGAPDPTAQTRSATADGGILLAGVGDDLLSGADGSDRIFGMDGDDTLRDGGGRDTLMGGEGRDLYLLDTDGETDVIDRFDPDQDRIDLTLTPMLYSADQISVVALTGGALLRYNQEQVILRSVDGSALSRDQVLATLVWDTDRPPLVLMRQTTGGEGPDTLDGHAGRDQILGGGGADLIRGGDSNDDLRGGVGDDTLYGGAGDDRIDAGAGRDVAHLGEGADLFSAADAVGDTVYGNAGQDTLRAGAGADQLWSGDGNDLIFGAGGHDTIYAGINHDTVYGGVGHDRIWGGDGRDLIHMGEGDDIFYDTAQGGLNGADTVWAGVGRDTLEGGNGGDVLYGEQGHDVIRGRKGNDSLYGGTFDDILDGGDDNDLIFGGDGHDTIYAGINHDTVYGGAGHDRIWGGDGRDAIHMGDGDDVFYDNGQGGSNGSDTVWAGAGRDTLEGGNGADVLLGENGHDLLLGRKGNDRLYGGLGRDTLEGGWGDDLIYGGAEADVFLFRDGSGRDTVMGFGDGADRLHLDPVLWGGARFSQQTVVQLYGETTQNGVVLTFETDRIVLNGFYNLSDLAPMIELL